MADLNRRSEESVVQLGLLADEDIELDTAALKLSALDHRGLGIEAYFERLHRIGRMLEAERSQVGDERLRTGIAQGALLSHVIGGQLGFAGDSETYDAPVNADMIRVLDRRRGLPVSLTILYVAAARRLGWFADALNTPGHVLMRIGPNETRALVDPFEGGALVPPARLITLLGREPQFGSWPADDHLEPMSNRMTLVRLLQNQAVRAERERDMERARELYRRMTIIAPGHGQGWWNLARLQILDGAQDAAKASLAAMLEITRDKEQRSQITASLLRLFGARGV